MPEQGVQTVVGSQIPLDLATVLDMAAKNALASRGLDIQDVQGQRNYEMQRAEFNRLGQEAMRQYALDVGRLGVDVASLNFQKRLAGAQNALSRGQLGVSAASVGISDSAQGYAQRQGRANTNLQVMGMMADRSGPQDWVGYQYVKDKLGAPTGQAVDPYSWTKDLVDPRYERGGGGVVGNWRDLIPAANAPEFDLGPDIQAPMLPAPAAPEAPPAADTFKPASNSWYVDNGSSGWQSNPAPWSTGPSPDDPAANFSGIRAQDVKAGRNLLTSGAGGAWNYSDLLPGLTVQDAQGNSYTNASQGQGTPSTGYWVVAPEGYRPPAMRRGGPTTAPMLLAGDDADGRSPNDEMIMNPTGAPLHIMDHGETNRFMDAMKARVSGDNIVLGREQGKRPFAERRARGTGSGALAGEWGKTPTNPALAMGSASPRSGIQRGPVATPESAAPAPEQSYGNDQRGGEVANGWEYGTIGNQVTANAMGVGAAGHGTGIQMGTKGLRPQDAWATPVTELQPYQLAALGPEARAAYDQRKGQFGTLEDQGRALEQAGGFKFGYTPGPAEQMASDEQIAYAARARIEAAMKAAQPAAGGMTMADAGWQPGYQYGTTLAERLSPATGGQGLGINLNDIFKYLPANWPQLGALMRKGSGEDRTGYGPVEGTRYTKNQGGPSYADLVTQMRRYMATPEFGAAVRRNPAALRNEKQPKMSVGNTEFVTQYNAQNGAPYIPRYVEGTGSWGPADDAALAERLGTGKPNYYSPNPLDIDNGEWVSDGSGGSYLVRNALSNVRAALSDVNRDPNSAQAMIDALKRMNAKLPIQERMPLGMGTTLVGDMRDYGNRLKSMTGFDANAIPMKVWGNGQTASGGPLRNEKDSITTAQAYAQAFGGEEGGQAAQEAAGNAPARSDLFNFGLKTTIPRYAAGTQNAWTSVTQPGYYGMPENPYYIKYGADQLGKQPFYQKLTGAMKARSYGGWGPTKISNPALGVEDAPTLLNLQTWRDMDITDREMTEGLYQKGLGVDFRDILERSARGAPIGVSHGAARYGGL